MHCHWVQLVCMVSVPLHPSNAISKTSLRQVRCPSISIAIIVSFIVEGSMAEVAPTCLTHTTCRPFSPLGKPFLWCKTLTQTLGPVNETKQVRTKLAQPVFALLHLAGISSACQPSSQLRVCKTHLPLVLPFFRGCSGRLCCCFSSSTVRQGWNCCEQQTCCQP